MDTAADILVKMIHGSCTTSCSNCHCSCQMHFCLQRLQTR